MAYSIERLPERISIGRETETGVTDVMIDCGAWVSKWPGMTLHAIHTPQGGAPYILQTETDGDVLVWHVTGTDTATPGTGLVEIVGETDGRRKVSATVKVSVAARMSGTVGEPPEAAKPWADRVVEAADRITGMKAQAKTLDAGSVATAAWDGQQGLLTIGVPKGKDGADGKDAVVDATLTQSGQAADAKATGDALALKLTEPSTGLAVGKYFRIAAIDESGHAVLEAVDAPVVGLSTEPSLWPLWTADEQAAARERMGIEQGTYTTDAIILEEGTKVVRVDISSILSDKDEITDVYVLIESKKVIATGSGHITSNRTKAVIGFFGSACFSTTAKRFVRMHTYSENGMCVCECASGSGNETIGNPMAWQYYKNSMDDTNFLLAKSREFVLNINATMSQGDTVVFCFTYRKGTGV